MTEQTISSFFVFTLFGKESPVYWHSSWISKNGSSHAPEKKDEEQMKYKKKQEIGCRFEHEHEFVDEHKVVECYEAAYSNEMRI